MLNSNKFHCLLYLILCVLFVVPHAKTQSAIEPIFAAAFNQSSFEQSGWNFIPSGTGEFTPASVSIGLIPQSDESPEMTNGRGVIITALKGEGSLVYGPVIPVEDELVLLRISAHALSEGGSIAMGALDVPPRGSLAAIDGSVAYNIDTDSSTFMDDYKQISVIYRPKSGAFIPVFQLAVNSESPSDVVIAMFDNFEVHPLNAETVTNPDLQVLMNITGPSVPTATPIPTSTGTPEPGVTPTPTPTVETTPTAPPASGIDITTEVIYEISPPDDELEASEPSVAHDRSTIYSVVAEDQITGFPDIVLRDVDTESDVVTEPVVVNEGFEDTETQQPDISIDFAGTRHVVWSDNRSIEKLYSIFLTQLDSFGERLVEQDFEVNILFEETNANEPASSVKDNGDLVVGWKDDRNFLVDMFIRRLRWTGVNIDTRGEEDFQVNIPFQNTNVFHPEVIMDELGNIVAVWSDDRILIDGTTKRRDVYARFFDFDTSLDENGLLPESESIPEIRMSASDNVLDHALLPKIAQANGRVLVVWQNEDPSTGTFSIHGAVATIEGEMLVNEFMIDDETTTRSNAPAVTHLEGDWFMISWHDERAEQIYLRIYDLANNLFLTEPVSIVESVIGLGKTGIAAGIENEFLSVWDSLSAEWRDVFGVSGHWSDMTDAAMSIQEPKAYKPVSLKAHSSIKEEKRRDITKSKNRVKQVKYSSKRN